VILNTPYCFNREMAINIASVRGVCVTTDENHQLRPDAIAAAITDRTRAVVTISPDNPTGAVYSPESLRAVSTVCRRTGVYHIHDEAYEHFVYDGAFYVLLRVNAEIDAMDLIRRLIREHKVAVIPGDTFGIEDGRRLRVAYGTLEKETVAEGIGPLARGLTAILG